MSSVLDLLERYSTRYLAWHFDYLRKVEAASVIPVKTPVSLPTESEFVLLRHRRDQLLLSPILLMIFFPLLYFTGGGTYVKLEEWARLAAAGKGPGNALMMHLIAMFLMIAPYLFLVMIILSLLWEVAAMWFWNRRARRIQSHLASLELLQSVWPPPPHTE